MYQLRRIAEKNQERPKLSSLVTGVSFLNCHQTMRFSILNNILIISSVTL